MPVLPDHVLRSRRIIRLLLPGGVYVSPNLRTSVDERRCEEDDSEGGVRNGEDEQASGNRQAGSSDHASCGPGHDDPARADGQKHGSVGGKARPFRFAPPARQEVFSRYGIHHVVRHINVGDDCVGRAVQGIDLPVAGVVLILVVRFTGGQAELIQFTMGHIDGQFMLTEPEAAGLAQALGLRTDAVEIVPRYDHVTIRKV